MRRLSSIQGRLLALMVASVCAAWAGTAAFTWLDVRHELDELLDAHLAQAAGLLVAQQTHEESEDDEVDAPILHRYAPKVTFQVFHAGRMALRSVSAPSSPMLGDPARAVNGFHTVQLDGAPWRVFVAEVAERDIQVYVGEQMQSRTAILWAVLRSSLLPSLLALPILLVGVWWFVGRGLAPLRVLIRELRMRAPDGLQPVRIEGLATEIAPVVQELNRLFDRVSGLMALERRFTADAAHELRTPIAAIRAQAQVASNEYDDAKRQWALRATMAGCDRAARLVDQLLTLSRLEAEETHEREIVDLGRLASHVAAEIATKALDKSQRLEVDARDGLLIRGDPVLMAVLIRNLVDNAIRYSPRAARIRLRVEEFAGAIVLSVDDSGSGLTQEQMQRLGERFFRGGLADESGSGLGWSIVRRVAQVLDCELAVRRSDLGGLEVRIAAKRADPAAGDAHP